MKTLLLEIGTEEIPAGYIEPALSALASTLAQKLDEARIAHGGVRTFGTPRRLAVVVDEVALRQTSLTSEVFGPPRKAAYDGEGRPTVAAVKFAEKVGLPLAKLGVVATPKGEYLRAVVTEAGGAASTVLKTILPAAILATPFPKSMRWAGLSISFARPIVWILALFGSSVIRFEVGNVRSGRSSFGHRFMHPRKIRIVDPSAYAPALRTGFVVVDAAERRKSIADEAAQAAASALLEATSAPAASSLAMVSLRFCGSASVPQTWAITARWRPAFRAELRARSSTSVRREVGSAAEP
jgi:glycyl-tRNA synthetase beta chain